MTPSRATTQPATETVNRNVEMERYYRDHAHRLLRFLLFAGAQPEDARDAAQHAFTEVWRRWEKVAQMENKDAYLRRIAVNHWRRQSARQREDLRRAVEGHWIQLAAIEDVYGRVEVDALLTSLATLPARQREVVAWLYDGYTREEIAKQLGMKVSTVRSNIRHAKERLRLQGLGGEEG